MHGKKLLFILAFIVIILGLIFPGCDKLITETNNITVIDDSLGRECLTCHNDTDNSFLRPKGQYQNSQHFASSRLIDAFVTINGDIFNVSACGAKCHTHEGYLLTFDEVSSSDTAYSVIGCFTCHMPHSGAYSAWRPDTLRGLMPTVQLNNGEYIKMGESNNCIHCHQASSVPVITSSVNIIPGWGPHYSPQVDLLTGSGGYFIDYEQNANVHQGDTITGGCIVCHYGTGDAPGQGYEFGEHTFRLQDIIGSDTTFYVENCGRSSGCHDGSTADEIVHFYDFELIDSIKSKTNQLEAILKTANILNVSDPDGLEITTDQTIKPEEARILYNYLLIVNDGSEGVHNLQFASQLLDSSIMKWDFIPRAGFNVIQTDSCVPVTVDFTDVSQGSIDTYYWDFGDGSVVTTIGSVSHDYSTYGIFNVTLLVSGNSGEDTLIRYSLIAIYDIPVADFSADAVTGCDTASRKDSVVVEFKDETPQGTTEQNWDFGDGNSAPGDSVRHTYLNPDSSYTVTFTATNPCGIDDTSMVIYTFIPVAKFTASDTTVSVDVPIQFTDESIGASSWSWDFGDDSTSVLQNPTHTYTTTGTKTVSLTVNNICSSADTTLIITVSQ